MDRIAVLTSGGDAPGMKIFELKWSDLGNVLHTGGTILGTARSERFFEDKWIDKAADNLKAHDIKDVVVIGGGGSFKGAVRLAQRGISVACVPATIDNDFGYTDYTIGFDTAVNTVLSIISKIRDTSSSHGRTIIIEVMGRTCGDIALSAGLGGGADVVLVPEISMNIQEIVDRVREGQAIGKLHNIIVKSEGVEIPTNELEEVIEGVTGTETRSVVLSYIQRGGSPTGRDRTLASLMGAEAVKILQENSNPVGIAVGIHCEAIISVPLQEAIDKAPIFHKELYDLAFMLS